jgi:hypothetical protein
VHNGINVKKNGEENKVNCLVFCIGKTKKTKEEYFFLIKEHILAMDIAVPNIRI